MIKIDEDTIFKEIKKRNAVSVALNAPDGLLPKVQETASKIMKRFGIPAYVLADTTWGSCDLNSNGAKVLGADVLFNIAHTVGVDFIEKNVVMIDAFDDISFDKIAKNSIDTLQGKTISLVTDSQHLHEIENVRKIYENAGIVVKIGKGKGQLNDGQVFGCEFYPVLETREVVDANVLLGQSNFHAAGIALSTNKPTYVLDPYFNEIREVTEFANKLKRKATLAIYKAAEAKTFGVIVGLKEGQLSKLTALKFKRELEKEGKEVQLIALTDITNDRLRNLKGIDAFIQATALLKILRNESIDEYLQIPHWL